MRRCLTAIEGSFRIKKKYTYVYQFVEEKFRNYKLSYFTYLLCIKDIIGGVFFFQIQILPNFFF